MTAFDPKQTFGGTLEAIGTAPASILNILAPRAVGWSAFGAKRPLGLERKGRTWPKANIAGRNLPSDRVFFLKP
jgi:hypothetical protein